MRTGARDSEPPGGIVSVFASTGSSLIVGVARGTGARSSGAEERFDPIIGLITEVLSLFVRAMLLAVGVRETEASKA
jgi:hypothetical protein